MKKERKEHSAFIDTMVKRLDKKEVAEPQTLVMDVPRDPELKSYLAEEDVKKIEEEVKRIKERVK